MKTIVTILATLLAFYTIVTAGEVTLAWDANSEPDIARYEIHYGVESRKYTAQEATTQTELQITNLIEGQTYFFAARAVNAVGIMSAFSEEITCTIPKQLASGWKVKFVDDEQADGFAAEYAIDGDPKTFWHTTWKDGQPVKPMPHEMQVDMGAVKAIAGFTYLPRQDEYEGSNIKGYQFYVSADGNEWGDPVSSGEIPQGKQLFTASFPSQSARYIRLVALSAHDGNGFSSIAELSVIESAPSSPPSAPKALRVVLAIGIK